MIDPKLLFWLATFVIVGLSLMLCTGFGLNAWGQMKANGLYLMPEDFMLIIKASLAAAVSCLVISARAVDRKKTSEKDKDETK